jgi:hypothetical protein
MGEFDEQLIRSHLQADDMSVDEGCVLNLCGHVEACLRLCARNFVVVHLLTGQSEKRGRSDLCYEGHPENDMANGI